MSRVLRYGEDLWESQREPRCSFICAQAFSTLTAIHQPVRMIPSDKLTSWYTTLTSPPPPPPPPLTSLLARNPNSPSTHATDSLILSA